MTNLLDDILGAIRRSEARARADRTEVAADLLGGLFADAEARTLQGAFGGSTEHDRDHLRSQADGLRLNELELSRLLNDGLPEGDEAERQDLASRRSPSGYIARPADGA